MKTLSLLYKSGEILFHTNDFANIWNISNPGYLKLKIKRLVDKGYIYRIYKGFFSLKDPKTISPYLLGSKAINNYSYLSLDTVLFENGDISQRPFQITFVSDINREISAAGHNFKYRQMKPEKLMDSSGIDFVDGYFRANSIRARQDALYYNPLKHFDR